MNLVPNPTTGADAPRWDLARMPDLHGKVAIVTGANSPASIGWHMAYQLALKGAKVYIGARSQEKAADGIKQMKDMASNPQDLAVHPLVMDLGDFKQVVRVVKEFYTLEDRLDILINNAVLGAGGAPFELDKNGISNTFAVNHLGPFLFTRELLPLLKKTATASPSSDVRIVIVTAESHRRALPNGERARFRNLDDLNNVKLECEEKLAPWYRYCYSKLANILFAQQLHRNLTKEGVPMSVLSLHPGVISTASAHRILGETGIQKHKDIFITPPEGALTGLFAATDPLVREEKEKYNGAYLIPYGTIYETSDEAKDENLALELWETCERVLGAALV